MKNFTKNDNGTAIVEAPMCIAIVLLIAMGVLTITQIAWTHMDLAKAVRDSARYGGRSEWDPSAETVTLERHRSIDEIKAFAVESASDAGIDTSNVVVTVTRNDEDITSQLAPDQPLQYGDHVTIEIKKLVANGLYGTGARITNAVSTIFGAGHPFNEDGVDIKAISSTYVE
jgi:hypothetical protein